MMEHPLVTVITPTYNHEGYISDCIQSVLNQTYPHWEMIIVDDGSTDNTLETAKKLASHDPRIKVFTQPNVGIFRLGETYNFAVSVSSGKYLAVLEGDDVWESSKLELQVNAMEKQPEAVLCWGKAYSSTADLTSNYKLYPLADKNLSVYNNTPLYEAAKHLVLGCFIPALTVMVRRDALQSIGGFLQVQRLPLVDLPTWQQLSLMGRFIYIPVVLGQWRIYPNQVTKTYLVELVEGFHRLAADFFAQCKPLGIFHEHDFRAISKHYMRMRVINYSRSGRYKLIRSDFRGARHDYLKSIFCFGTYEPGWKLRSLIGIIFSLFHANIEGFAHLLGRVSYRQ